MRWREARCRAAGSSGGVAEAAVGAALPARIAFRSSTVNSALPSSVGRNWMQALTVRRRRPRTASGSPGAASSPMTVVQAPQSPSSQPSLVPVQRASSRSHSSTLRVGAASATSTIAPRWKNRIGRLVMGGSALRVDARKVALYVPATICWHAYCLSSISYDTACRVRQDRGLPHPGPADLDHRTQRLAGRHAPAQHPAGRQRPAEAAARADRRSAAGALRQRHGAHRDRAAAARAGRPPAAGRRPPVRRRTRASAASSR